MLFIDFLSPVFIRGRILLREFGYSDRDASLSEPVHERR